MKRKVVFTEFPIYIEFLNHIYHCDWQKVRHAVDENGGTHPQTGEYAVIADVGALYDFLSRYAAAHGVAITCSMSADVVKVELCKNEEKL